MHNLTSPSQPDYLSFDGAPSGDISFLMSLSTLYFATLRETIAFHFMAVLYKGNVTKLQLRPHNSPGCQESVYKIIHNIALYVMLRMWALDEQP